MEEFIERLRTVGVLPFKFDLSSNLSVTFWDCAGKQSQRRVCVHIMRVFYCV